MRKLLAFVAALLISGSAFAQAVQQSGTVSAGHSSRWVTSGVLGDAGSATNSNITEMGVTKNGGIPFSVNSANTGALTRLYQSVTDGAATIGVTSLGGASDGTLTFNMNGNSVTLPATPGGTIVPTVTTTPSIADSAPVCFSGTGGTLKNCGGTPGTGTVTSITAGTGIAASPDPITSSGAISLAPIADGNLLGNSSGSAAPPSAQAIGSGLSLSGGTLAIGNAAVTNAMLENVATNTLKGRSTAGTGSPEDITVGSGLVLSAGTLSATVPTAQVIVPVRQTILSGPVDSNGLAAFGGSTGSSTVTASGTLIATSANGFGSSGSVNNVCSITNPSWTGLTTTGNYYLYLDASSSTCTTGSTTLAPTYQWGGTYSTTNNQFTFNIQEMIGKLGNGSTATQSNLVFVGQVAVAGAVTTSITWYQLMGRYTGAWTATLPSNASIATANHNIGVNTIAVTFEAKNTTTDAGYGVGDIVSLTPSYAASATVNVPRWSALETSTVTGSGWYIQNASSGAQVALTLADWQWRFRAQRTW